jgi:hypothetical protein
MIELRVGREEARRCWTKSEVLEEKRVGDGGTGKKRVQPRELAQVI